MRNYNVDYSRYTFKAEDDWGDYDYGKPRNGYKDKHGYAVHSYLCDDGSFHTILEHIVKWEYFNGDIPEGMEIDHIIPVKDGGTNHLGNLRVVTHKENMNNETTLVKMRIKFRDEERNDKISNKLKGKKKTERHRQNSAMGHWKKVYQYTKEKELVKIWDSAKQADENGYYYKNVLRCCRGERKTHKGYIWSFVPL